MADKYVNDSWSLTTRIKTAWRACRNPAAARAMLDAYDHGRAMILIDMTSRETSDGIEVLPRSGDLSIQIERGPILHIPRRLFK